MTNGPTRAIFEALVADPAIAAMLTATADPADSIFEDQADDDAATPFIIISSPAGMPEYSLGDEIAWEDFLFRVKAVVEGSDAKPAGDLAELIDARLTDSPLTISDRVFVELHRIGNINLNEPDNGTRYIHRGGTYQFWIS